LRIGAARGTTGDSDYFINDFIIFNLVQHTANYVPGYSVEDHPFLSSNVILPEMEYAGAGTLQVVQSLITIESGVPRYTLQIGRSGDYLYWDGVDWVVSDGTYAQANDIATMEANASSLVVAGQKYGQFKIHFTNSNTISDVDNLIVILTGQVYPVDNPTIMPISVINADGFVSYSENAIKPGSDDIKNVIEIDGQNKYWNGSAWADSTGYFQSNSAGESNDNALNLSISLGVSLRPVWYLHTDEGKTTPMLDLGIMKILQLKLRQDRRNLSRIEIFSWMVKLVQ
jgi:hypothetical protein